MDFIRDNEGIQPAKMQDAQKFPAARHTRSEKQP